MKVVLYEPEIPPNTGNIARLCAAFDVELHLVEPLGFRLEDRYLRRAGLDYWPHVRLKVWRDWQGFLHGEKSQRLVLATTRSSQLLPDFRFRKDDILVFGPETRGLPDAILYAFPLHVRIPGRRMEAGGVRSLNLSSACAIILYTALNDSGLLADFQ